MVGYEHMSEVWGSHPKEFEKHVESEASQINNVLSFMCRWNFFVFDYYIVIMSLSWRFYFRDELGDENITSEPNSFTSQNRKEPLRFKDDFGLNS